MPWPSGPLVGLGTEHVLYGRRGGWKRFFCWRQRVLTAVQVFGVLCEMQIEDTVSEGAEKLTDVQVPAAARRSHLLCDVALQPRLPASPKR